MFTSERRKRVKELSRELTSNPFFPLLFIGESIKSTAFHLVAGQPPLDVVAAAGLMAVFSVVGWLYAYDDVAWGLSKAAEAVEGDT